MVGVDVHGMGPQPGIDDADQAGLAHPVHGGDRRMIVGKMPGLAVDGEEVGLQVEPVQLGGVGPPVVGGGDEAIV